MKQSKTIISTPHPKPTKLLQVWDQSHLDTDHADLEVDADVTLDLPLDVSEHGASDSHLVSALHQRQVDEDADGKRLDVALAAWLPHMTRSFIQQLVAQGAVTVDGREMTKSAQKLRFGQEIQILERPTEQSQAFVPQAMDLAVVFEDEHLLVVNKAAGLVVHPAAGHWQGTLMNGLLAHHAGAADLPRAGIVHRLDKDTSGLMVVAKTRVCMDALVDMIANREVKRQYLAIGSKAWTAAPELHIDAAIGRDPKNRLRMAVVDLSRNGGKPAQTTVQCLDSTSVHADHTACLLRCLLQTGRTHQIRVHLASKGVPLLADTTYGAKHSTVMSRQALHAQLLALKHPVTGQYWQWFAPVPVDFEQAATALGLGQALAAAQHEALQSTREVYA